MSGFKLSFNISAAVVLFCVTSATFAQHHEPSAAPPATTSKDARVGDAYPFDTCPTTGKKLGSMGDPVTKLYEGREVRFCCPACPPKFEQELAANLAKLDEKIIKDQSPIYPLGTSVVSGKPLPEHPVQFVHGNRLIRVVDESEKTTFSNHVKTYLEALDKAVIEKQGKDYAVTKCPVSGDGLGGDMGNPVDIVVAGRLIRLCCNDCKKDVDEDPAKFIALADAAAKAKAKPGS